MNFLIMVATMSVAWVGQWLKSKPNYPTPVVVFSMAGIGLVFYGLGHGWPTFERESMLAWFDQGWLWAAALPGVASMIGLAPGMETKR